MPEHKQGSEPSRPAPPPLAVGLRFITPVLEVVALVAAYQQHEGLAVVAKTLAVVLQQAAAGLVASRHRR